MKEDLMAIGGDSEEDEDDPIMYNIKEGPLCAIISSPELAHSVLVSLLDYVKGDIGQFADGLAEPTKAIFAFVTETHDPNMRHIMHNIHMYMIIYLMGRIPEAAAFMAKQYDDVSSIWASNASNLLSVLPRWSDEDRVANFNSKRRSVAVQASVVTMVDERIQKMIKIVAFGDIERQDDITP